MNTQQINKIIVDLQSDIRSRVIGVLRNSKYYGEADICDVAQDVSEYLARVTLPAYDDTKGASVKTFVLMQAKNMAINYVKTACRRHEHLSADTTDETADEAKPVIVKCADPSPALRAMLAQDATRLSDAIDALAASDALFIREWLRTESIKKAGEAVSLSPVAATRAKLRIIGELKKTLAV
jgi:DNA-directed RNA polymerase specialized sigma24 family protein